jgi:hypothetical protein
MEYLGRKLQGDSAISDFSHCIVLSPEHSKSDRLRMRGRGLLGQLVKKNELSGSDGTMVSGAS